MSTVERTPSLDNLVRLAEVLGTTPAELLRGVGGEVEDTDATEEAVRVLRSMSPSRREAAVRVLQEIAGLE